MVQDADPTAGYITRVYEYDGRYGPKIDLGLGTSPIGAATELRELLSTRDPLAQLERYSKDPMHTETKTLLLNWLGLGGFATPAQVMFGGNGSYGLGDEAIRHLANNSVNGNSPARRVLALPYSFPNVSQWCIRHPKISYEPIEAGFITWKDSLRSLSDIDDFTGSVVYIDYPNNPSGDTAHEAMVGLIAHIHERGGIPLVDFAFAEVLGDEFRAVLRTTLKSGGIALGSLSKTQGLPGLRAGWMVLANEHLNEAYGLNSTQNLVFGINHEAETVMEALYRRDETGKSLADIHAQRVCQHNETINPLLYDMLRRVGLIVYPTDSRTSIQIVVDPNGGDLYGRLAKHGIVVESLADYNITLPHDTRFVPLGNSATRMITPNKEQLELLSERLLIAFQ